MPSLEKIRLTQFRNYNTREFSFPAPVTAICGINGVGKTNLLDAIYYLCFTKSYFSRTDASSVQQGAHGFRIEGDWQSTDGRHQVACVLRETGKKEVWVDQDPLPRFSGHIGRFTAVMVAPDDIELVSGGPELRRKLIDTLLCQIDGGYLRMLVRYNKVLQERNSFLKQTSGPHTVDVSLLEILDNQLVEAGEFIFQYRSRFMADFLPAVTRFYQRIALQQESPVLQYYSPLQGEEFAELLRSNRSRDLALQRTTTGIHRDDIEIYTADLLFRQTASQGQRKSLLFALKLAEFESLKQAKGFAPLLLLDDIFEKLDEHRMQQLLSWVCRENTGQVFLTDTHEERMRTILQKNEVVFELLRI